MSRTNLDLSALLFHALLSFLGSAHQSMTVVLQSDQDAVVPTDYLFFPQVRCAIYHSCFLVHLSLVSSLHVKTTPNLMYQENSCNYHVFSKMCLGMQVCPLVPLGSCCFVPVSSSCLQCSSPNTGGAAGYAKGFQLPGWWAYRTWLLWCWDRITGPVAWN